MATLLYRDWIEEALERILLTLVSMTLLAFGT